MIGIQSRSLEAESQDSHEESSHCVDVYHEIEGS